MTTYFYSEKGRSLRTISITTFLTALAGLLFWAASPVSIVIGAILALFATSGLYALLKGETWSVCVKDNILSWTCARWPKSSGSIDLNTVRHIVVNDSSSTLSFNLQNGSTQTIRLIGFADRLRDYLRESLPNLKVEFVQG